MTQNAEQRPLVSVLVPVRNDREGLEDLLAALDQQSLPPEQFEIVVGDDGSDAGFFDEMSARARLTIVPGAAANPYVALNRARSAARADVLAICDSDCLPEKDWLERGVAAVREHDLVAGAIRLRRPASLSIWTIVYLDLIHDQEAKVRAGSVMSGNVFVRAALFDGVGGFDETLPSGGDQDFGHRCAAAGCPAVYRADVVMRHPPRRGGRAFVRKVWFVQYNLARRTAPSNWWLPPFLRPGAIPLLGMARRRTAAGRPVRLNRQRLAEEGIQVGWLEEAAALVLIYGVLQYVAAAASTKAYVDHQLARFRQGRQMAEPATRSPVGIRSAGESSGDE